MVTAKTQYSLANAQSYFEEHLAVGDYYQEGQKIGGEWFGIGAESLGLSGKVGEAEFLALCENQHPRTGDGLTQRKNVVRKEDGETKANRRIFYDFTFSPPKSVSIAGLVVGDERIVESHERAVRVALTEFETFAATRVRKRMADTSRLKRNLVAALFTHDTSRALDLHLHTHCIAFNAIRRLEDLDSAALTYAEVKAIASGNPLVIEKAQVDAELMRLTRLRSAHAEEQYRIRSNLRRSHEDAEMFTTRLTNLRQDITVRQDTTADKFIIELAGQETNNRGVAGELILRRAEKLKDRFGDDVRIGRFAGFDLFLRPSFNNTVEVVVRGRNSYAARVTDTAQGTIRSLESTVQGFEERAAKLEADIADAHKRGKELEAKVGAAFEHEGRYHQLTRRQSEIEEKLDLTKNQAPSQAEADSSEDTARKNSETQDRTVRQKRRAGVTV